MSFETVFKIKKPVIGMIHLEALPGTPKYKGSINQIIEKALSEAEVYQKAGIDALAIENMHDVPYLRNSVGHEVSSIMSIIGYQLKQNFNLPCGVQVLAGANREALAVANSAGLDFVRVEGFVFAHVADEGIIESCAGDILRYRKQIGADNILVFSDIKKKHSSHAITADIDIVEVAKAAEFFISDGVIITGSSTGTEASIEEIQAVKKGCKLPVIVGSGVTLDNLAEYVNNCDAMIVGSYFKKDGYWVNPVDYERVSKFMSKVNNLR